MSEAAAGPRRLHPVTLIGRSLQIVPQMLAGGAGYAAVIAREGPGRILVFAAIAGAVGLALALVAWWRFRYTVGEREIVIESGLLHRRRRVIPFDRVQDIAIERPLLARLFGTARVKVETGASGADEGNLDMVALADAQALRDRIRRWHAGSAAAASAGPGEPAEPVLFGMALGRLLLSGLFDFSLLFLAIVFGAIQYLDDFGLIEPERWFTAERAEAAGTMATAQATAALIALLLLLGLVSGLARTLARDYGFRLTRTEAGFRRRLGLFTLSEVVIPLSRMQVAVIDSGPVARLLGWYRLSFQTLGADRREGGLQVAAPFARMDELLPVLAEAGFPPPPPRSEWARVPRRALLRWSGQYLAAGAVAAAAALLFEPRAAFAAAALVLLAGYAAGRWRKHAYALGERALFVVDGLLRRRLWTIPFDRAQTIGVSQGPLQRGLRLSSLLVDTAGGSLMRAPEIVDLDSSDAEALYRRLAGLFRRARAARRAWA